MSQPTSPRTTSPWRWQTRAVPPPPAPGEVRVINGDNFAFLNGAANRGERFELVEIDGPYGASLEAWDKLSEDEYLAHYTPRLSRVADVLAPNGVVFVFGYAEMIALLRAWARESGRLTHRRWLHWHVQQSAHAGRRVQVIAVFVPASGDDLFTRFRHEVAARRAAMGKTIWQVRQEIGLRLYGEDGKAGGGFLWYEAETSTPPNLATYELLKRYFQLPDEYDSVPALESIPGVTNIDYLKVPPEKAVHLNDNGLRSKPRGLYDILFRPCLPRHEGQKRALICYGGSGNAATVAAGLGYAVTICESQRRRAATIEDTWAGAGAEAVEPAPLALPLPLPPPAQQMAMEGVGGD